jgi:ligand-binding sensor domain-containing protein
MSSLETEDLRGRAAYVALVFGWAALSVLAVWRLLPTSVAYEPPEGWVRFASGLAIQDVMSDGGLILAAGVGGLHEIDQDGRDRPVDLSAVPGLGSPPILRAMARDSQGRLWLGHQNGLAIRDGNTWMEAMLEHAGAPGTVRALAVDAAGKVWAGGQGGLFREKGEGGAVVPVDLPQPNAEVTALTFDRAGNLWVGTASHGVFLLANGTWFNWTVRHGLPHPQVTSLLVGGDGRVWCGTGFYNKGGAVAFRADPASHWRLSDTLSVPDLAGAKVRSLYEDADRRLWLGHEYDGITIRSDGKTARFVTEADGLPDPEVTLIRPGADGSLWIGTMKGVLHLSPAAIRALLPVSPGGGHES